MEFFKFIRISVLLTCLFGFAAVAWADDIAVQGGNAQEAVGEEAIVAKVEGSKVTLQSTVDTARECVVPMIDTEDLKVGDKVKVQGNLVSKVGNVSGSGSKTAPSPASQTGTP